MKKVLSMASTSAKSHRQATARRLAELLKLSVFIDFVRDTSDTGDTEPLSDVRDVEYEPCTDEEEDMPALGDSSGQSDNEIISTKVIEVCVRDDGDLEFADSELTGTDESDSEVDLCDYWRCAQCGAANNNPLYRYCERCFKVRKSFFPPRPKRKKRKTYKEETRPLSQDSGIDSQETLNPQPLTGSSKSDAPKTQTTLDECSPNANIQSTSVASTNEVRLAENHSRKRRAESAERESKKVRVDSDSDSEKGDVSPLIKTVSDPSVTVEDVTNKALSDKEIDKEGNMCIVCYSEPKSGAFVHGRIAHICCCYKCAVKVWSKTKRCPVCNCKVSNVLRAVVM